MWWPWVVSSDPREGPVEGQLGPPREGTREGAIWATKRGVYIDTIFCHTPPPPPRPSHTQIALQQKLQAEIKEENMKKKELVEKTLKERYTLSQQESLRLKKIQAELVSLDELVTRDVAVLREKIEAANRLHNAARSVGVVDGRGTP